MKIAFDFDGTVVEHKFPIIGEPIPGALDTLRDLVEAGHELILWTCREDHNSDPDMQYLAVAIEYLETNGVVLASVNESILDQYTGVGYIARRKVYADIYIDDRNVCGFPGWPAIREFFGLESLKIWPEAKGQIKMKGAKVVPTHLATLVFSWASADMEEVRRERLIKALSSTVDVLMSNPRDWMKLVVPADDLKQLLGGAENGGVPLRPVTSEGRIQAPDGDWEGIYYTYAYDQLKKALKDAK